MTFHSAFRVISGAVLMATLVLIYRVHPIAGWATLTMLAVGTLIARRRKPSGIVVD